MDTAECLLCPIGQSKTRIMVREDIVLPKCALFCPKCRQQTLVDVQKRKMSMIKKPTLRRRTDELVK